MSDVTKFLLARIAEDEDAAREAMGGDVVTSHDPDFTITGWPSCEYPGRVVIVGPERVLAECEAKRSILELAADAEARTVMQLPKDYMRATLRSLAVVYADHADYREEWRPPGA